ncbi:membrane protein [Ralstonia solanacearum]|nr:membrane protein [Ralstonia solanacearum]
MVAQSYAFGILLVVLSLITAAAMLATKHPAHMERAACWVVGLLIDWRSWALLTVGLVVVAVTYTLLQPRR